MAKPARPKGRPPEDEPPAAPEEGVLQAALEAFAAHGFNGMSVRTLSRELGVSHLFAGRGPTERLFTGAPLAHAHPGVYADAVAGFVMNALRP